MADCVCDACNDGAEGGVRGMEVGGGCRVRRFGGAVRRLVSQNRLMRPVHSVFNLLRRTKAAGDGRAMFVRGW